MKRGLFLLISVALHILAIGAIIFAFLPMAKWYFDANPLWGVDFFYTASIVNLLKSNLVLPQLGWGYAWFTGWPMLSNYPILNYYFILPFTFFFPLLASVKMWMLISLGLYFVGIYAACYAVSKNYVLSVIIAIAGIYSVGVYGTLMWGGSLPNHATQAFFPWVLFFIISYLKSHNIRYLLFASILGGIAIWAHPQIVIAYIYPSSAILFIFWLRGMKFVKRLKSLLLYMAISFFIALPFSYPFLGSALSGFIVRDSYKVASSTAAGAPSGAPSQVSKDIIAFHKAQPMRIFTDTNTTLFYMVAGAFLFFLVMLIIHRRKKSIAYVIPFIALAIYFVVYIWMFAYGISIYHGGWYRLFWATPLWVGLLAAAFWGAGQEALVGVLKRFKFIDVISISIISIGIGVYGYVAVNNDSIGIQDRIVKRSTQSSAFPDKLNMRNSEKGFESLKKELVPDWINPDNTNYRLYTAEQTVNIWWNSLNKMPLARGYLDPLFPDLGYSFWLDASLNQTGGKDQLVGSFKYPDEIALNNTLFLVDWYAIKYFEAGPTGAAYNPLPKSLTVNAYIAREKEFSFNEERYTKTNQILHYYELKDEYVIPVLSATNAKTLGIFASDRGYETIVRAIADMNLSSKILIPIKLGQYIDKLKANDISAMDSLIVYDYKYSNKENSFRLLTDYVKKGGKIFIDTGVEVKEANATDTLPEIFPIEKTTRKPLGTSWDFEIVDTSLTQGADFTKFDPPLFDSAPWNISYPSTNDDMRDNVKIILKNHNIPVMISQSIDDGFVIWSGMNLPYHTIRSHNVEEVRFFKNIIEKLFEGTSSSGAPIYETKFINPQKRQITFQGANGVLFKEQAFPGWSAKIESNNKSRGLTIFKAGPANPGFMYISLPMSYSQSNTIVTFTYSGSLRSWILCIISFGGMLVIIEEAFLGGFIIGRLRRALFQKAHRQVRSWWAKEDEE